MDSVEIPFLLPNTRIDSALSELRARKRAGLVMKGKSKSRVLYAGDLLYGRKSGVVTLGDVETGSAIVTLQDKDITKFKLDLDEPTRTWKQYESFLRSVDCGYTLLGTSGSSARIVTVSEEYGTALRLTGGYECDGEPTHYFPLPRVVIGENCPLWPACRPKDGGTGKPKIRPSA